MSKPGRPQKNRIKRHATYSPEFLSEMDSQILNGESFGETVERLLEEKSDTILELRQQLAEYQSHDMQTKQDDGEAIRRVSLALQAWMMNPADIAARSAFESALGSALRQAPKL